MKDKIGLCLAGGGVKGAAHIGAIKALEEANISFEYVGGASSRKYCGMFVCHGISSR